MYIKITRVCETNAPFDIFENATNDWTHFMHLHHKSHADFRLLYKQGNREIFFYKSWVIYPLPFYTRYIVLREYIPEQCGYKQVYFDVANGRTHYLNGIITEGNGTVKSTGEFWFSVPWIWKFFPRLFFLFFKTRMRRVMREDNSMIMERIPLDGIENQKCAPVIPENFNFYEEFTRKKVPPPAQFEFTDHVFQHLSTKSS